MKAWRGKKRIAKKLNRAYFQEPWYRETLQYLLKAKPGDLIHACTGFNHRIKTVEFVVRQSHGNRTFAVVEAEVTDDSGGLHWFPGGGCVSMPETREEIERWWLAWDTADGRATLEEWKDHFGSWALDAIEKLKRGEHVVDEDGIKL